MELYYTNHPEKAKELVLVQLADGWTVGDICEYFECLGYDYFFARSIIPPELLK